MKPDIYSMELHNQVIITEEDNYLVIVRRVAAGWIYTTFIIGFSSDSVFVPYDNSFQGQS